MANINDMYGNAVYLSKCKPADLPELFKAMQWEPESRWQYLPYGKPMAIGDLYERQAKIEQNGGVVLVIRSVGTEAILGTLSIVNLSVEYKCVEIGHVFFFDAMRKSKVGHKPGLEAVYLALESAFEDFGARRVQWCCHHKNEASKALAQSAGFTHEGILRNEKFYKGENRDTFVFSAIQSEWAGIRRCLTEVLN